MNRQVPNDEIGWEMPRVRAASGRSLFGRVPFPMGNFDQRDLADRFAPIELLPEPLPTDPMPTVERWYEEAHAKRIQPNPNAMSLATIDADGKPQCRIVLCKELNARHGWLMFYTNYESRKGAALSHHPHAAVVMHWDALDRQIRIEGAIERATDAESDAYYASRALESRLGAWASDQSRPIASRAEMLERVRATAERFGITQQMLERNEGDVPRPAHWGGFRLWATRVELWVAGPGRVHDRAAWTRKIDVKGGGATCTPWTSTRLQP